MVNCENNVLHSTTSTIRYGQEYDESKCTDDTPQHIKLKKKIIASNKTV